MNHPRPFIVETNDFPDMLYIRCETLHEAKIAKDAIEKTLAFCGHGHTTITKITLDDSCLVIPWTNIDRFWLCSDGTLAWGANYPVFYLIDGEDHCADCASKILDDSPDDMRHAYAVQVGNDCDPELTVCYECGHIIVEEEEEEEEEEKEEKEDGQ